MAQTAQAHSRIGDKTAQRHRALQSKVDKAEEKASTPSKKPPQTGARDYPVPPFPKQHLKKPGIEARLEPAPMFDAPFYHGSKKLDGKVALITGGDSGHWAGCGGAVCPRRRGHRNCSPG